MKKIFKPRDLNLKVYVEDTDFQGFVYHANYIKFFERARSEFLQDNKISQKELRINNLAFVVKRIEIDFLFPGRLGDELIVESLIEKKSNARMIFKQDIVNSNDNKKLCSGMVEVCLIDIESKKPRRLPDNLLLILDEDKLNE